MADTTTLEVMIATYDNETQASTVLSGLKRMQDAVTTKLEELKFD